MASHVCPLLGTLDAHNRRGPHVEYPSFENQCLASGSPELIVLGDQAMNCLAAGHTACPRFRASRHAHEEGAGFVPFLGSAEEAWPPQPAGAGGMASMVGLDAPGPIEQGGRTRWARLGAALIFLTVLLCGSSTAAYMGWEWITTATCAPETAAGRVDVAAAAQAAATPAVYVVMTATPLPAAEQMPAAMQTPGAGGDGSLLPALPVAVTPTPIRIEVGGLSAPMPEPATAQQAPAIDVDLMVPTRRPTPEFDVPTSTPAAGQVEASLPGPTDTPSVTPTPLGTPIIIFAPVAKELEKGECTMVRWNVQNVREVYYENLPMNGQGEREECINDEDEVYTLMVVLANGQPQIYTTTVEYLPPTPTPTPTPVFTPEPVHTATWTPEPPTPTPPPNLYAVNLSVNGSSEVSCPAGQSCEVGLLVTNGGSGVDNVSVLLLASDTIPVQLCRPDGVCGGSSVPILNMGASNTAFVVARFSVPAEAASQSRGTASFQPRSDGSGGGVTSSPLNVTVVVP